MKKLIVFDLDGTLAVSKSSLDSEMAQLLLGLLNHLQVAIISGGDWPQFQLQVLRGLSGSENLKNLLLLPTCGTKYYRYTGEWTKIYSEDFTPEEKSKILSALQEAIKKSNFTIPQTWGEQIEDRGSQITFSALGQQAPISEKHHWDPDFKKRQSMKLYLDALIPGFTVRLGGTTSVDVTKKGIDKAYGIRKLRDLLGIAISEMVFLGDAIFPGGNDYPAKEAGVTSILVRDPEETKRILEGILAFMT